jgi:hypothetical protein
MAVTPSSPMPFPETLIDIREELVSIPAANAMAPFVQEKSLFKSLS